MTVRTHMLTAAQREAVEHVDGPLLILAGPGSGKTRVVTHRIAHLLGEGVAASQIVALTFTNKAAEEMQSRVDALAPGKRVWLSTFHRFCARLLREYASCVGLEPNFTIYDAGDSRRALKQVLDELDRDSSFYPPEQISAAISKAKNRLVLPDDYAKSARSPLTSIAAEVYPRYRQRLLDSNAVDFDDLLLHVATLLRSEPEIRRSLDDRFRYVLVDEYQDTNLAQYAIARGLSIDHPNLAATGDPDQSIYGWRGATLSNILEFEKDFPDARVVRLEQNYRSTRRILDVAAALIAHNRLRKEKDLFTENDEGQPVQLTAYATHKHEADAIVAGIVADVTSGRRRARDFAIFYRVNALSRAIESSLREHGVAYQMVNGLEFFQRKEVKDVLAYLQLLNNPRDDVAFERIVNTPPRGIGRTTITRLWEHAARYRVPLLAAAREAGLIESLPKRSAVKVAQFVAMLDAVGETVDPPVETLIRRVIELSGYRDSLLASEIEEDQQRLANIEELLTAAREFDAQHPEPGRLEAFLEQTSLVSDTDAFEADDDRVTLMTLHAAKGLEFPVVHIVAMEQGLIPHERSLDEPDQLEEERRLLFVGITRAQSELRLSYASRREFRGQSRMTVPSMFQAELPVREMAVSEPDIALDDWAAAAQYHDEEDVWHDGADDAHTAGDISFDPDSFEAEAPPRASTPMDSSFAGRLVTAADMAAGSAGRTANEHEFVDGMTVLHPEYGLGQVVTVSGGPSKRMATVQFSAGPPKKFMLRSCVLRPVKAK
ncbi:MAG: UvrD-helicase domain-containing protein [Pirellulales bacterium]